ncbi:MAG: lysophospholipid acyltransferase family protein [Candidatus Izemoplasma sp.]
MVILSFYIYIFIFGYGFYNLLNPNFTTVWGYLIAIIILILSVVFAFISELIFMKLLYLIRRKKDPKNSFNHAYANSVLNLIRHLTRIKLIVTGKENIPPSNFVFVGNHQENWDIIIVMPIFKGLPMNFIAKESLFSVPILGKWIELLGNIPISRTADRSAAISIIKGVRTVKSGMPMAIFPEGKRSFSNEMLEFKPGAFKLAMKSKTDILIGTLYDSSNVLKGYPFKKQIVRVDLQKILKYEDYKNLSSFELADLVKGRIQDQLDKFDIEFN